MRKFTLELPKRRLELHIKLTKRRKPLVTEPLMPTRALIRRKYRSGSLIGKIVRHISGHKKARRVAVANMAAFMVMGSYLPAAQANVKDVSLDEPVQETVIQAQNTLTTQKAVQFPLEKNRINQRYSVFHPGVDLGADMGDPIKAIKAGVVTEAEYSSYGYGNTVVVNHTDDLASRYAHLSEIEVTVGQEVTTNSEIGTVGVTGHSTGPHLHLEVTQKGSALNPLTIIGK
jgi:murein DD-endopeptidase MepM/ murein hydrolase activator NlpD